jgi:flagellar biosynthesis anti-sigma factor FlgM
MGQTDMMIERPKRPGAYSDLRRASRAAARADGEKAEGASSASSSGTEVHVSDEALLFIEMKKRLQALPDIREDRVEVVRRKLLDGVYSMPPVEAT